MAIEEAILEFYNDFILAMPPNLKMIPPVFFIAITLTIYSIFIWYFYRFLARRDVLKLNLKKYNVYKHDALIKFFAVLFYIAEFLIVGPIVIFFWFTILSLSFIILAKDLEIGTVMLICAALISAIRITSYFNEGLAKELAKMVPFTMIAVVITTPDFWDLSTMIGRISQIPDFFTNSLYYLLFIFMLELVLRIFFLPMQIAVSIKDEKE
ncbi:hypothetical protein M0R72_09860 [Candidatus Pacearchaeota archaeon]|jgi:hypothetical protein|nr:hypothetical protein [Candidatus Pacearchaeota archaeon]